MLNTIIDMKKRHLFFLALALCSFSALRGQEESKMKVWSPAFKYGGAIPEQYSCEGADLSIPLYFALVPEGSRSLVLIMEDPDAPGGVFVHWLLYNIPPVQKVLSEGWSSGQREASGIRQGRNDFGNKNYGGPCPPRGSHRYYIRLYALDIPSDFEEGLSKAELLKRISGHVLAEAEWMGIYTR